MLEKRRPASRPRTHAEINEFRRKALIEGTIRSLGEHGVAGTTVRSICQEAGSSRGLAGHYFPSKEHLVEAAFRYLLGGMRQRVEKAQSEAGDDPRAKLHRLVDVLFSSDLFTETIRNAFITFWHEIRFNELVREANREIYGDYKMRAQNLFAEAAGQRGIKLNPENAALGLVTMIDGHWLVVAVYENLTDDKRAAAVCHEYIDLQLGIRKEE